MHRDPGKIGGYWPLGSILILRKDSHAPFSYFSPLNSLPNRLPGSASELGVPVQHPQGAECVPAAGLTGALLHVEVDLTGVWVLERPSPLAIPLFLDQSDGLHDPSVRFDPGSPQIVQTPQDVVVPA